jgi:hypothetical protein
VLPDHRGFASNGPKNWDSAFLPSQHAGTIIYPGAETPIADLFPHKSGRYISARSDREGFELLEQLNRKHMRCARRTRGSTPHPELRTGREDAARRAGGARHLEGVMR